MELSVCHLEKGITKFNWKILTDDVKEAANDLMRSFDFSGDNKMGFSEFCLMQGVVSPTFKQSLKCDNCMLKTRREIAYFFSYVLGMKEKAKKDLEEQTGKTVNAESDTNTISLKDLIAVLPSMSWGEDFDTSSFEKLFVGDGELNLVELEQRLLKLIWEDLFLVELDKLTEKLTEILDKGGDSKEKGEKEKKKKEETPKEEDNDDEDKTKISENENENDDEKVDTSTLKNLIGGDDMEQLKKQSVSEDKPTVQEQYVDKKNQQSQSKPNEDEAKKKQREADLKAKAEEDRRKEEEEAQKKKIEEAAKNNDEDGTELKQENVEDKTKSEVSKKSEVPISEEDKKLKETTKLLLENLLNDKKIDEKTKADYLLEIDHLQKEELKTRVEEIKKSLGITNSDSKVQSNQEGNSDVKKDPVQTQSQTQTQTQNQDSNDQSKNEVNKGTLDVKKGTSDVNKGTGNKQGGTGQGKLFLKAMKSANLILNRQKYEPKASKRTMAFKRKIEAKGKTSVNIPLPAKRPDVAQKYTKNTLVTDIKRRYLTTINAKTNFNAKTEGKVVAKVEENTANTELPIQIPENPYYIPNRIDLDNVDYSQKGPQSIRLPFANVFAKEMFKSHKEREKIAENYFKSMDESKKKGALMNKLFNLFKKSPVEMENYFIYGDRNLL